MWNLQSTWHTYIWFMIHESLHNLLLGVVTGNSTPISSINCHFYFMCMLTADFTFPSSLSLAPMFFIQEVHDHITELLHAVAAATFGNIDTLLYWKLCIAIVLTNNLLKIICSFIWKKNACTCKYYWYMQTVIETGIIVEIPDNLEALVTCTKDLSCC